MVPDAGGSIGLPAGVPDLQDLLDLTGNARFQSLLGASQPQQPAQGAAPEDPAHATLLGTGQTGATLPPGLAPPVQGAAAGAALPAVPGRGATDTAPGPPRPDMSAGHMPATGAPFDLPRPALAGAPPGGEVPVPARADGAVAAAEPRPTAEAQPAMSQPSVTTAQPAPAAAANPPAGAPVAGPAGPPATARPPGQAAGASPVQPPQAPQHGSAAAVPELAHPAMPATAAAAALPRPPAQSASQQSTDPLQTIVRAAWHAPSHPAAGWLALAGTTAALPPLPPVAASRPRHVQPLRAYRHPPQPALFWVQTQAAPARRLLAYTDLRPVPLDLAPHTPALACWRLDDTEALILTDDPGEGASAAALHARLMDDASPLALLRPGQGFATWEGSPLWLRLADIAKPPALGVLLAESAPARLQVMRQARGLEATWLRDGAVTQTRIIAAGTSLPRQMLCGHAFPEGCAVAIHAARALAEPLRSRVQEAVAAAARLEIRLAAASGRQLHGQWTGLAARGRAVLGRVLQGEVHGLDAWDGVALAMALDRLPADHVAGALA